jgi:hypothetical protein
MALELLIAASLFAASQPALATAPVVEVGEANWSAFPKLKMRDRRFPTAGMLDAAETILRERQCQLPGQSYKYFDITIPYAVQLEPNGAASRVVVADIGCPALETYVGSLVLELAKRGDFQANSQSNPRWYSSQFNFTMQ